MTFLTLRTTFDMVSIESKVRPRVYADAWIAQELSAAADAPGEAVEIE